jgi:RNA polymerase sigma factor (sigma-70 family)
MATGHMEGVVRHIRRLALQDVRRLADGQLLEAFLVQKDESAFEALVRRHGPMVLAVCRRVLGDFHEAEDAFQATFLVLVRRAASIGRRELLGNWLYGVAYRTAMKSRAAVGRRRSKEKELADFPSPAAPAKEMPEELLSCLDQELNRLPHKYRAPLVACDLEGCSRNQAARSLGWPIGTLNWRLARARAILAKRLTRRGMTLCGAAVAMALAQRAIAVVPASLVAQTLKVGMLITTGEGATVGLISAQVASLTEGIVRAMVFAKLRIGMAVLAAIAVFGTGAGLWIHGGVTAAESASSTSDEPQPRAAREPAETESGAPVRTENFLVDAPTREIAVKVAIAAERWRRNNAILWLGEVLPSWSQPCPIHVKITDGGSHSATSLAFADGKVMSQRISLEGPLNRLLHADVPHEVTHLVLAHYFGWPMPRWADEGAAILSSDKVERDRHERVLHRLLSGSDRFVPLRRLFGLHDYPTDTTAFYPESYSITRFLVESKDRKTFLEFVSRGVRDGWDEAAKRCYGYHGVTEMETAWLRRATEPGRQSDDGPSYIAPDGKTHPYYSLVWKLIRIGPKGKEEIIVPTFVVADGAHFKLVRTNGTWVRNPTRVQDVRAASAVLDVEVFDRPSGKVRLDLSVQDNDVRKALKDDTLVVGYNLSVTREVDVGEELRLVLAEDDNGAPKRWIELALLPNRDR